MLASSPPSQLRLKIYRLLAPLPFTSSSLPTDILLLQPSTQEAYELALKCGRRPDPRAILRNWFEGGGITESFATPLDGIKQVCGWVFKWWEQEQAGGDRRSLDDRNDTDAKKRWLRVEQGIIPKFAVEAVVSSSPTRISEIVLGLTRDFSLHLFISGSMEQNQIGYPFPVPRAAPSVHRASFRNCTYLTSFSTSRRVSGDSTIFSGFPRSLASTALISPSPRSSSAASCSQNRVVKPGRTLSARRRRCRRTTTSFSLFVLPSGLCAQTTRRLTYLLFSLA